MPGHGTGHDRAYKNGRFDRSPLAADGSGDRDDLEFLIACSDDVAGGLAQQQPRDRRHMGDRAGLRIGFILADDAIGLHAAVGSAEGDRRAEGHRLGRRRIGHDARGAQPFHEVAGVAQRNRRLAPPFVDVLELLRGLIGLARVLELKLQGFQPGLRHQIGMGRDRAIGQQRF